MNKEDKRPALSIPFCMAYAKMNGQQRDASVNPVTGKKCVVVGELEFECLRVLAGEVERLSKGFTGG